jgi:alpha-glucan, water dikinase
VTDPESMKKTETIATRSGLQLQIETCLEHNELVVVFHAPAGRRCLLHWGVRGPNEAKWRMPPTESWPPGTRPHGQNAIQSPFVPQNGQASLRVCLSAPSEFASLDFALFFPEDRRWDNNNGRDYQIVLRHTSPAETSLPSSLRALISKEEIVFERIFDVEGQGQLAAATSKLVDRYRVTLLSNVPGMLALHWGIARRSPHEWLLPPESMRGAGTTIWQDHTAQTPFVLADGLNALRLEFPETDAPLGLQFVLKQDQEAGRWLKHNGGNFYVPVRRGFAAKDSSLGGAALGSLAEEIIRAEMTHNSWTLMHRFNLCYDLLDRARNDIDGQALLYVWLRFSAIRQLTWQRNYNTKPSELAHAQDRLTQKLAEFYRSEPATRPLLRLTLATVGRGGEGQRIRDEILNIMHRHHVKEVSGHFLEEWHQKLHNNTTPDDVVICEAYLEFLRSNGNANRFYKTLEAGGVTRQRLEGFERPIRSSPQFVGHLKEGLLHDFGEFLKVLKASHSGTDLETAINAARDQLDGDFQGLLHYLWQRRNDPNESLVHFVRQITAARRRLSQLLPHSGRLRELLYLDLALEQLLRGVVERNIHLPFGGDPLADLIACVLENVTLSYEDPELAACSRHWERLQPLPRFGTDWSLHAKSVVDRIGRALSDWMDRFDKMLQPKAEHLGHGFQAETWTIKLFSEEVVRGNSSGFVLSGLLRHLDPLLRQSAHIGSWQIVSRGRGTGEVVLAESLRAIQSAQFKAPTIILADKVMGDEEIPENVTAVIAPDVTDIVSHVAVRARNANLLFASCLDAELFQSLKAMAGRFLDLEVNPSGDVVVQEAAAAAAPQPAPRARPAPPAAPARRFVKYALTLDEFNESLVGGKSCRLAQLEGHLPIWIHLPSSMAIPFGVFEEVLSLSANRETARRYEGLLANAEQGKAEQLAALRETVQGLSAPPELPEVLRAAASAAGLVWPGDWELAWSRIKQVWASKWNDRAVLSRRKIGMPQQSLVMAVLIQEVVAADYAFVIHTTNPSTGNTNEIFAEVVLGLGETLVGNFPGRALGFTWDKRTQKQTLLAYPSKSTALYGRGLIFRSDSNGEDLEGYAGAGLYDSVLLEPPRPVTVDYTREPLVWDTGFRENLLATVAQIGLEVERACSSPQDVEGAIRQDQYYVVQTRSQVGTDAPA